MPRTPFRLLLVLGIVAVVLGGLWAMRGRSPEEIRAVGTHEPGDLAARLEQRMAMAYALPAPAPSQARRPSGWTLVPRLHAQAGVTVFVYDLLKQSLEYYQQVVIPKFDRLPTSDCLSGATFDAIQTYLHWRASVELLLPMQRDEDLLRSPEYRDAFDRLVAQRETQLRERGYTAGQIEEINRTVGQFREQFERMLAAVDRRIPPALRAQFTALHRCCTTQRPMAYHLTAMMKILRFAELTGHGPVDAEPMRKVMECSCLIGSNQPNAQERFTGTLEYEEKTALEKTTQQASRTIVNSERLTFHQSSVLTFAHRSGMLSSSTAGGTLSRSSATTDDHGSCVVHNESQLDVEGQDSDTGLVNIDVNPEQGRYSLSFERLALEGSGTRRSIWNVKGPGCGPFNKARDERKPVSTPIAPVPDTTVNGVLDAKQPHVLKGSHVFEQADPFYGEKRRGTLKWEFERCKR